MFPATFQSISEAAVLNMIRAIALQEWLVVYLTRKFFSLTYSIIAQAAFGKRSNCQEEFIPVIVVEVQIVAGLNVANLNPSANYVRWVNRQSMLEYFDAVPSEFH